MSALGVLAVVFLALFLCLSTFVIAGCALSAIYRDKALERMKEKS